VLIRHGSFAFVEYEDKRDADDAYYDMHNKRLGRDDILKIEVSVRPAEPASASSPRSYAAAVGPYSSVCLVAFRLRS